MSISDSVKALQDSARRSALIWNKDKSNEELESIIKHNFIIGQGQDLVASAKALGEIQACREILQARQKADEEYSQVLSELDEIKYLQWDDLLHKKRMQAVLNLPFASSYHGQLVAAILQEEDGMNADEIRKWSEELTAMEDKSYTELLAGLVKEKILSVSDEEYYIRNICTEDLLPKDPILYAERLLAEKNEKLDDKKRNFILYIKETGEPASEFDWADIVGSDYDKKRVRERMEWPANILGLNALVSAGVLSKTPAKSAKRNLYYFTMLGEGEKEK